MKDRTSVLNETGAYFLNKTVAYFLNKTGVYFLKIKVSNKPTLRDWRLFSWIVHHQITAKRAMS